MICDVEKKLIAEYIYDIAQGRILDWDNFECMVRTIHEAVDEGIRWAAEEEGFDEYEGVM